MPANLEMPPFTERIRDERSPGWGRGWLLGDALQSLRGAHGTKWPNVGFQYWFFFPFISTSLHFNYSKLTHRRRRNL